jgi:hypothetical protein
MPPDTELLSLTYKYPRFTGKGIDTENGHFIPRVESNIIDLGLIAPDGSQVGASGSDKSNFQVSETFATPGYRRTSLVPGEWQIILGAYKVAPQGVMVAYELTFTPKQVRLLKGDLHTHTVASDGVLALDELGKHARAHGLDFLAITDHNQVATGDALPDIPGLTMLPGVEWTHYKGHANFTGVDKPFGGSFLANTQEEVLEKFQSARDSGALITVNHPFDENVPFTFDLDSLPFDCYEVWNGPMRMSNIQAIGTWSAMLTAGKKVPIVCGSDYHRSQLFLYPGGPTTCVYAKSAGRSDILAALKQGHAYMVYAPDGPTLDLKAGDAIMGDSVSFSEVNEMQVSVKGLQAGDVVQVVTGRDTVQLVQAESNGEFEGTYRMPAPGFARVEITREFIPGVPRLPALISNPIYFDKGEEGL